MIDYEDLREFLRKNAPQVKTFVHDKNFTGTITTVERIDKGPQGYDKVEFTFKDVEELKKYYGQTSGTKRVPRVVKARASVKKSKGIIKRAMAKLKPKKRNV